MTRTLFPPRNPPTAPIPTGLLHRPSVGVQRTRANRAGHGVTTACDAQGRAGAENRRPRDRTIPTEEERRDRALHCYPRHRRLCALLLSVSKKASTTDRHGLPWGSRSRACRRRSNPSKFPIQIPLVMPCIACRLPTAPIRKRLLTQRQCPIPLRNSRAPHFFGGIGITACEGLDSASCLLAVPKWREASAIL